MTKKCVLFENQRIMNTINNMGGILFADILYKSEISLFAVHNNSACIRIKDGHDWHNLPIHSVIESPTVTPEVTDAGTTYKHSVTIRFAFPVLPIPQAEEIRNRIIEGCILLCQDTNGYKYIYGTDIYTLFGTLNRVIGKKVTDFTGYELKLSGVSKYPVLQYSRI